jgi:hypothetical protein
MNKHLIIVVVFAAALWSCKKDSTPEENNTNTENTADNCAPNYAFNAGSITGPRLIFKFKFDSTQARLNNIGQPAGLPAGHAGQSPLFNGISQHYIELAGDFDLIGGGEVLYVGAETNAGGANAIDYCASTITGENEIFFSKPLSEITPGSYKWLRVSLAYQNYNIKYKSSLIPGNQIGTGTIASFVGFRTYLNNYLLNGTTYSPSENTGGAGNHSQGYWGFETNVFGTKYFIDGQAPEGATTVPNPFLTSPIPPGSCVVTGQFTNNTMANSPLTITGSETEDIVITVSLSTNKSFEWIEVNADGFYQPELGEAVVDMGLRGLIPIKN